jgi:cytoskeleton-associated protein 5
VNIQCVIGAAKVVEKLAKGLRKHFSPYSSNAISALLERCREKKGTVVGALRDALDAVFPAVIVFFAILIRR